MNRKAEKQTIESPTGLDLKPTPPRAVRISRRAGILGGAVLLFVLGTLAYGAYKTTQRRSAAIQQGAEQTNAGPATQAAAEIVAATPAGVAPLEAHSIKPASPPELVPPGTSPVNTAGGCGVDPKTNQTYRFDPQSGKPCSTAPTQPGIPTAGAGQVATSYRPANVAGNQSAANAAVRQMVQNQNQYGPSVQPQLTPQQQALLMEYKRLYEARVSGTAVKFDAGKSAEPTVVGNSAELQPAVLPREDKDTLRSSRTAPVSPYEIRAGWEIPGVLEQDLNSDLPGQIKALVMENVYDTATGKYLLIPQGSRLIGTYDSKVGFGQTGLTVAWSRLMYPDGSAIDLNSMQGLDAHGQAGFRDQVNNHYARLFGQAALSSLFSFGLGFSQSRNQSALTYPSPTQVGEAGAMQDMMTTSSQITRRNLNIQPTIHIRAGYKFVVRVDRDIVFQAAYAPLEPGQSATMKRDAQKISQETSPKGSR
jgi:type IV secretory pathway VirB10-like protein